MTTTNAGNKTKHFQSLDENWLTKKKKSCSITICKDLHLNFINLAACSHSHVMEQSTLWILLCLQFAPQLVIGGAGGRLVL